MKWFVGINTIAELRTKYRQLLKKYHPDNPGGSVEITQEINKEYDKIFDLLNIKSAETDETQFTEEENQQFKEKAWTWHYGEYKRHHKKEISIDDIRAKYGTETVRGKVKQNTIAG